MAEQQQVYKSVETGEVTTDPRLFPTYRSGNTIQFHGHVIIPNLAEGDDFPEKAYDGEVIMKQGQMWNYGTMSGVTAWHPVTPPKSVYVHNQAVPAATWYVMHGLDTQSIIVTVYSNDTADGSYRLVASPPVGFTDDNNVFVSFSTPVGGRAVVMSQGGAPSASQTLIPKMQEVLGGGGFESSVVATNDDGTPAKVRMKMTYSQDY